MSEVVIVWAKRTPIGRAGGQFHTLEPSDLVAPLLKQAIKDTVGDASLVDDVMIGNVVGPGGNVARVSLLQAGFPVTVPGVTIDRQCGSGLEAIMRGFEAIKSGQAQIILAGGVESVSRASLENGSTDKTWGSAYALYAGSFYPCCLRRP